MKKDRMSERLSEFQVFDLVKIYKEFDCLWDVTHKDYKNRQVRDNAYKEILAKLNIPRLKLTDIPQKIKNLRTSYYTELKKIEHSVRAGAKVYRPKVAWFSMVDEMLRNVSSNQLLWNPNETKTIEIEPEAEPSAKTAKKDDKQKKITTIYKIARLETPPTTSPQKSEPQTIYHEDDEFDVYGKYIAMSLRSMPEEMSILARMELQKTMANIQLKILKHKELEINQKEDGCLTPKKEEDPLEDTMDDTEEMEPKVTLSVKVEEDQDL